MDIILIVTIAGIAILSIWALRYYKNYKSKKEGEKNNEHMFEFIPSLFPTIGILTTVIGIAVGLYSFDEEDIEKSIPDLLGGLKTAFVGTLLGMVGLIFFSGWNVIKKHKIEQEEKDKKSGEVIAIEQLIEEIKELKKNLAHTNEQGNVVSLGNVVRDIYTTNIKQEEALRSFATDLPMQIGSVFEGIVNNEDKGMLVELKEIKTAIENMSDKLKSPAEDMTKTIAENLEKSMNKMIEEFKQAIKGEVQTEMDSLVKNLISVSNSLQSFPDTMEKVQREMVNNFKEILEKLKGETLSTTETLGSKATEQVGLISEQSQQFNQQISALLDTINKNFAESISQQQQEQKNIVAEQTKHLETSAKLLVELNQSLESMKNMVQSVNSNIETLNDSYKKLQGTTSSFEKITENIGDTSKALEDSQSEFSKYSDNFLKKNADNIKEIQTSLTTAKGVSADYAEKFQVIETGLKGIFGEIQTGLQDYQNTVKKNLEDFLNAYSDNLSKCVESLSTAISEQNELIEELNEAVSKIKS